MQNRTRQAFVIVSSVLAVLTTHVLAEAANSRIVVETIPSSVVGDGRLTPRVVSVGPVTHKSAQLQSKLSEQVASNDTRKAYK